jgi:hypothetical protein
VLSRSSGWTFRVRSAGHPLTFVNGFIWFRATTFYSAVHNGLLYKHAVWSHDDLIRGTWV